MSASIYKFFADLVNKRNQLSTCRELESFPFDNNMILGRQKGKFPDLVLHTHPANGGFYGGEFIEIKDSKKSHTITSFNSSLPQGQKSINEVFSPTNLILKKIKENGTDKHPKIWY